MIPTLKNGCTNLSKDFVYDDIKCGISIIICPEHQNSMTN